MGNYAVFMLTILFASTLSAPPSTGKHYRSDYQYNEQTDAFYKLHIESRRKNDIKKVCEVEGASLMVPATQEDIAQVHGMFKQYPDLGQYLWVETDGHDHEAADQPVRFDPSFYATNFDDNYDEEGEDVVYVHSMSHNLNSCDVLTRGGEVEELPCYKELPFVCKVEAKDAPYDPHCDVFANNYQYNATVGSCYSIRRWAASWNEAYTECRAEGAHLVVLNSEAEMAVVHALMEATPRVDGARNPWYYFAGFRAKRPVGNETAVFRTIFNQTLSEAGYDGWSPGEPNNWNHEYCGTLLSSDGKLNDANCDHLYAFICETEYHAPE